jgi:hypothetical protein
MCFLREDVVDNFGVVGGADEAGVETLEGFRDSGFRVVAGGGIAQGRRDAETQRRRDAETQRRRGFFGAWMVVVL